MKVALNTITLHHSQMLLTKDGYESGFYNITVVIKIYLLHMQVIRTMDGIV